jgi:hypothetical protein
MLGPWRFYTQSMVSRHTRVILTRMRVNMTRNIIQNIKIKKELLVTFKPIRAVTKRCDKLFQ